MTNPEPLDLVVADRRQVADDVVSLTLRRPDGGELPAWTPGAHVDLLLGPDLVRQYSLCGMPADRTTWRLAVQREPEGRGGSAYVHARLTPGRTARVLGPRNNFPLVSSPSYRFIAGGIGITPLLPMLDAAREAGASWSMLYGGRSRASMAFTDELSARHDGERVLLRPQDEHGLLDLDTYLAGLTDGELVYCCGPAPLIEAVEARVPPAQLRVERFTAKEVTAADRPFEVQLRKSGLRLTVPPGRSILDVVREAGVQVLFSCTEGTCGTCETDIHEGEAEHRDSVLTAEEQRSGATMMICVSRATGSHLVLDL